MATNRLIESDLSELDKDNIIQHLSSRVETLEQEKSELEIGVEKQKRLDLTNGNFDVYEKIAQITGFWKRRRIVRLMRTSQDTTDSEVVFRVGSLSSRFFLELTYPQLTGLIKLLVLAVVGLTTGSTIWFRIQDFIPWL